MLPNIRVTDLELADVKSYLKIDYSDDDILLSTMLMAALSFIQNYLCRNFSDFDDIPVEFTIAALSIISHWYENRQIQSRDIGNAPELRYVFSGLLDMHRNWSIPTSEDVVI